MPLCPSPRLLSTSVGIQTPRSNRDGDHLTSHGTEDRTPREITEFADAISQSPEPPSGRTDEPSPQRRLSGPGPEN